jgi:hypothetical protein
MKPAASLFLSAAVFMLLIALTESEDVLFWLSLTLAIIAMIVHLIDTLYVPGQSDPLD